MPGPISDSYDPEFSTSSNAQEIVDALQKLYGKISEILDNKPPIYILNLVRMDDVLTKKIDFNLTEYEVRLLRFSLERAIDSI